MLVQCERERKCLCHEEDFVKRAYRHHQPSCSFLISQDQKNTGTTEPHTSHNTHNILKNRFNFLIPLFSTLKTNISAKKNFSQKKTHIYSTVMCVVLTNRKNRRQILRITWRKKGRKNPFSQIACAMYL